MFRALACLVLCCASAFAQSVGGGSGISATSGAGFNNALPRFPLTICTERWAASPPYSYIYQTSDGAAFSAPAGVTNPVFTFPQANGMGTSLGTGECSILYKQSNATYYLAYEYTTTGQVTTAFGIASASSLNGPWTWLADVPIFLASCSGCSCATHCYVAAPQFFVDDDGSIHVWAMAGTNSLLYQPYIVDALNSTLTSWSIRVQATITGVDYGTHSIRDIFLVSPKQSPLGIYSLWYVDGTMTNGVPYISLATSSTPNGPYTVSQSGDWLGIYSQSPTGIGWEGVTVHPTSSGWTMYFVPSGPTGPWWYMTGTSWSSWSGTAVKTTGITVNGGSTQATSGSYMLTAP